MLFYALHVPFQKTFSMVKPFKGRSKIRVDNNFFYIEEPCYYKCSRTNSIIVGESKKVPSFLYEELKKTNMIKNTHNIYIASSHDIWPVYGTYVSRKDFEYVYGSYIDSNTLINSYKNNDERCFHLWRDYFKSNDKVHFDKMIESAFRMIDG